MDNQIDYGRLADAIAPRALQHALDVRSLGRERDDALRLLLRWLREDLTPPRFQMLHQESEELLTRAGMLVAKEGA